jgi:hypothetical protein
MDAPFQKTGLAAAVEGTLRFNEWWDFPGDAIRSDFRNFLFLVWEHIGLPEPTSGQYEFAYFLQHGYAGYCKLTDERIVKRYDREWYALDYVLRDTAVPLDTPKQTGRADIIMGFRGVGKSYISAAFGLWKLFRDPVNEKVLVVSASGVKAREFVAQAKGIIMSMALLAHLRPGAPGWTATSRDQIDRFDVAGHSQSQSPSLKAAGITGQITGSRATTIIPDDIEVPDNSKTEDARAYLLRLTNEFDAILLPGPDAMIVFLGTPQTEESVYIRLIKERGFNCFCFPARYPRADKRASYVLKRDGGAEVDILAPILRVVDRNADLQWRPTDPKRFGDVELLARESKGRSFFMLQFMLDTSLSDAERYPLKQRDLIVMACNPFKAPMTLQWGHDSDKRNYRNDIPNVGFSGDHFLGPLFIDKEWREYTASVLYVDPSGGGADEIAWCVLKELHGMLYALKVGGVSGKDAGLSKEAAQAQAMKQIARDAAVFKVNEIIVEPNYGGVIWIAAFSPILAKEGNGFTCSVEEAEWSRGMKEARDLDTLEPVIHNHRLVVSEDVARDQVLMHQLTHICRERGALSHDDRIDALAGAVARLANAMMLDTKQAAKARVDEELDAELEDFIDTCKLGTMRRGRIISSRSKGERLNLESIVDPDAERPKGPSRYPSTVRRP